MFGIGHTHSFSTMCSTFPLEGARRCWATSVPLPTTWLADGRSTRAQHGPAVCPFPQPTIRRSVAWIGPWQRPGIGTFGTAGYNSLRGPPYYDTDVAIIKEIAVSESYLVQFRTDFLNVFNQVNLGNPSGCVDCFSTLGQATGGVITTLAPNASQRQVEFSLRVQF